MLLYPGFGVGKEEYSVFAGTVAGAGYTVLVQQQLQSVDPADAQDAGEPVNVIAPTATGLALDWLQQQASGEVPGGYGGELPSSCRTPDLDTVLLASHSWGCTVVCLPRCSVGLYIASRVGVLAVWFSDYSSEGHFSCGPFHPGRRDE